MLTWSIIFFVLAVIAGLLGFGVISFAAAEIAKILFFIFVLLFVLSIIMRVARKADDVVDRGL